MAKKAAKKKKVGDKPAKLFSIAAVHRELKKAKMRIAGETQTPAAAKLAAALKAASLMLDCGQNMAPDIS